MSHPSKAKGNRYERELVEAAQNVGVDAERLWGSDGRSRGLHEQVDVIFRDVDGNDHYAQSKFYKSIAGYLKPDTDAKLILERSTGALLVIMPIETYFDLLLTGTAAFETLEYYNRKSVNDLYVPVDAVEIQVYRENYGDSLVTMPYETLLSDYDIELALPDAFRTLCEEHGWTPLP